MISTARPAALFALFFLQAMALGMWIVPLANVFRAHDLEALVPWVFACTGVCAFISPLIVGALADQRTAPTRVLRWIGLGTAITLAINCTAIEQGWGPSWVLSLAFAQALLSAPSWSLSTSIVLSHLPNPGRQFGPVRAGATAGWMVGGWIISWGLHADASVVSGYSAALVWLTVVGVTWLLPETRPPDATTQRRWYEVLGLDALTLLKNRDHRVVFITAALFSAPVAAFYPYTALHLRDLGIENVSARMSLGQTTEILALLILSGLMTRVRLKWVFLAGIAFGVLRYLWYSWGTEGWLMAGIFVHGFAFTLYFITTQIYLEDRIDKKWRARAQSLLALLMGGVGGLAGYLGGGWWHEACHTAAGTDWHRFWTGEWVVTASVFVFFLVAYRGKGRHMRDETAA